MACFDRGLYHWGAISCVFVKLISGQLLCRKQTRRQAPSARRVPQVSFTSLWFISYRIMICLLFLSGCHVPHPTVFSKGWFCVAARNRQAFTSCLSAMSLIMTQCFLRSVRAEESFRSQISERLSGFMRWGVFTSWLWVDWAQRCLNGPALHCRSPSHRTGPGAQTWKTWIRTATNS